MFQRTKRFFKKSIETVKSYFSSEGYEKLSKTPSYNGRHNAGSGLENIYSEFVDQREASNRIVAISYEKNTNNLNHKKPSMMINQHEADRRKQPKQKGTSTTREREEKRGFVTSKLKELENLDSKNVDYVLDIQEVLHFYSRLTCPVYCEIVEKFFMEMYSEVFSLPLRPDNSMPRESSIQL